MNEYENGFDDEEIRRNGNVRTAVAMEERIERAFHHDEPDFSIFDDLSAGDEPTDDDLRKIERWVESQGFVEVESNEDFPRIYVPDHDEPDYRQAA